MRTDGPEGIPKTVLFATFCGPPKNRFRRNLPSASTRGRAGGNPTVNTSIVTPVRDSAQSIWSRISDVRFVSRDSPDHPDALCANMAPLRIVYGGGATIPAGSAYSTRLE